MSPECSETSRSTRDPFTCGLPAMMPPAYTRSAVLHLSSVVVEWIRETYFGACEGAALGAPLATCTRFECEIPISGSVADDGLHACHPTAGVATPPSREVEFRAQSKPKVRFQCGSSQFRVGAKAHAARVRAVCAELQESHRLG